MHGRAVAPAREALGEDAFTALVEEGRVMRAADAVALRKTADPSTTRA
jgi:hypothetical protein